MTEPIKVEQYALITYVSPEMANDDRLGEMMRATITKQAEKAGWTVLPDTFDLQLHERNFASPVEWQDGVPDDYLLARATIRVYRATAR